MGKRHRKKRKWAKAILFRLGYRETELGELKKRMSKAEARLILAKHVYWRRVAEHEVQNLVHDKAVRDLQDIEDAIFIESLSTHISNQPTIGVSE